ncbi:hypothetical protein BGY98DRAFT_1187787 [Russula aff. rugulosa BPL654]|nr:hypothetical protein BGY98DRAFT_1187787 [Russula aff. rugulosa BPL654]
MLKPAASLTDSQHLKGAQEMLSDLTKSGLEEAHIVRTIHTLTYTISTLKRRSRLRKRATATPQSKSTSTREAHETATCSTDDLETTTASASPSGDPLVSAFYPTSSVSSPRNSSPRASFLGSRNGSAASLARIDDASAFRSQPLSSASLSLGRAWEFPSEPDESSAARPLSSSQPSGPAGGSMDVEQLLPPIHEEPLSVSSQVHASPSIGDEWNKMWRDLIQGQFPSKPEESPAAHPSSATSSSQPSGPAGGSMDVEQLLPSSPEGPSQVPGSDLTPPSPDDEMNKLWLTLFGRPESYFFAKSGESSATHPLSSSQPSGLAGGSMAVNNPLPSISKEPLSLASSSDRAPLSVGDGLNNMWVNLIDQPEGHFPSELSATRPPSISQM